MLALAGAAPEVFRLLSLTGLDRFLRSYDSVDTAIHAVSA
jgi:anti-anti-sigma regulatory factor